MGKNYEVSIRFTKKVSKNQLAGAVKQATKAKVKGFMFDNLNTYSGMDAPVTRTRKSSPRKSTAKKTGKKR